MKTTKIMNKILILLIAISIFATSCSEPEKDINEQIREYKTQITDLNIKVAELEKQNKNEYKGLRVPVKAEKISQKSFSHQFMASGELEAINEAFISPEISGQITDIYVNEGEEVKKGQLLAKINTIIIDNSIIEIKEQLALAKIVYNKQSKLWKQKIGSEIQYLEAKNNFDNLSNRLTSLNAQRNLAYIKSPIDGIVENINLKKGELASPGIQFMQLVNIDNLYVTLQLSEAHISSVKKGDSVVITFPPYPELSFSQPVYRTGNVINPQNRTFITEIKIDNNNHLLKPNMLANVKINDYNNEKAIVVPSILIKEDMSGKFIFLIDTIENNTIAKKQYIKTGKSFNDHTEIIDGINIGDIIITDGYNKVSNGFVVDIFE